MEQWSDGRPDKMARSSGRLTGNRNLHSAKSSESSMNSEIPVYSIFIHTSDFVQTHNEAKILTRDNNNGLTIIRVSPIVKEIYFYVLPLIQW